MDAAVRQQLEYEIPQTRKKLSVIHPRKRGGYPDEVSRRHRTRSRRTSAGTAAIGVQAQSRPHSGVSQASAVRSVSRTQTHSRLRLVYWIAVCLCTVATLVLLLSSLLRYNEMSAVNRKVRATVAEVEELKAQRDTLNMQLAPYLEPARIEEIAKRRLGMQYPTKEQKLSVARDPSTVMKNQTAAESQETKTLAANPQHKE